MLSNNMFSIYAATLMMVGAAIVGISWVTPPRVEVANITLNPDDVVRAEAETAQQAAEAAGEIETADLPPSVRNAPPSGIGWNYPAIEWRSFNSGLDEMRRQDKPGLLVLQKSDCPVCRAYQHVFHDPEMQELTQDYVFILADAEAEPELQRKFNVDGAYLPRTFILSPDGGLREPLRPGFGRQQFFVDPYDSQELLQLMQAAR